MPTVSNEPTELSDIWRDYHTLFTNHLEAVNKAPMTIRTYGVAVDQLGAFLQRHGYPVDPLAVTREHLTEFMRYLPKPKADGGFGLGDASTLQRYRSIQQFWKFLKQSGDRPDDPMADMRPPALPEKLVPVVRDDDLRALFKAVSGSTFIDKRDKAIIALFIDTGMRLGEMATITTESLDMTTREVVVMGKGRRERPLKFVKDTQNDLLRYRTARRAHKHAELPEFWLGRYGAFGGTGIYQMLQDRCEQAKIAPIHPHQLRHTFAHLYLKAGGNEGNLMKVAGWRSRSMVDRYGASVATVRALEAHDEFSPRKGLS